VIALALLKAGQPKDHPRIQTAISQITSVANSSVRYGELYSVGLSLIFLIEHDPVAHRPTINKLIEYLLSVQKKEGGWGYPEKPTGDTSMTQYAVLGLWVANEAGFSVPIERWERVTNWLLRTQDPSGAFGYQGVDPGIGASQLVAQEEIRHSMAAGGLGSLYVCADYLGLASAVDRGDLAAGGPLKPVNRPDDVGLTSIAARTRNVSAARLQAAQDRGNAWMGANYTVQPPQWTHYYLYGLERYQSFRGLAAGSLEREPRWYNDGVSFLVSTQKPNGSWEGQCGVAVDTAFSVLFLARSTQQTIEVVRRFGKGVFVGGRGIPKDADELEVGVGGVRARKLNDSVEKLLNAVETETHPDYERAVESLEQLHLDERVDARLSEWAVRLRRMAGGSDPVRRAAVLRALAQAGEFSDIPILIEALDDPQPIVRNAAEEALRFLSRRGDGFGLKPNASDQDRADNIRRWWTWYRELAPDDEPRRR
jgi:Prenyltransferase and squalene oxidase repeat